jgi:hypothetical protein
MMGAVFDGLTVQLPEGLAELHHGVECQEILKIRFQNSGQVGMLVINRFGLLLLAELLDPVLLHRPLVLLFKLPLDLVSHLELVGNLEILWPQRLGELLVLARKDIVQIELVLELKAVLLLESHGLEDSVRVL